MTDLDPRGSGRPGASVSSDGQHWRKQPRVPRDDPSHHGGRWTDERGTGGGQISSVAARRNSPARGAPAAPGSGSAVDVVLPNGWRVVDAHEPGSFLRSPVADLSPVAQAGRETGETYRSLSLNPFVGTADAASLYFVSRFFVHVGTGGVYDYQRSGNQILGVSGLVPFVQRREFRDVSNFNVGLFCQQAGLSLGETLTVTGLYASRFSGNKRPAEPYGLDARTREFVVTGFSVGESGVYGLATRPVN